MPIFITPAAPSKPTPVTLANTLGYSVNARYTVTSCSGKLLAQGKTLTVSTGTEVTAPSKGQAEFISWSITRTGNATGGDETVATLTSRQGCTTKPDFSKVAPPAHHEAVTGTKVTTAPHSSDLPLIGGVALGVIVLAAVAIKVFRPRRGYKGGHR